jgi:hypothetical protein
MNKITCPNCRRQILSLATNCRCGWTKEKPKVLPKNHTQCAASASCRFPGRLKLGDGYVCVEHYALDPRRFLKAS